MTTVRNAPVTPVRWRTMTSGSIVVAFLRGVVEGTRRAPIADASADEVVVHIGTSSTVFCALATPCETVFAAWPHSWAASATSRWLSVRLEIRVRFVAITVAVAALTHIALTRFRAPQPTIAARAMWIIALILLTTIAAGSRSIAAAWTDWRGRRANPGEGDTA